MDTVGARGPVRRTTLPLARLPVPRHLLRNPGHGLRRGERCAACAKYESARYGRATNRPGPDRCRRLRCGRGHRPPGHPRWTHRPTAGDRPCARATKFAAFIVGLPYEALGVASICRAADAAQLRGRRGTCRRFAATTPSKRRHFGRRIRTTTEPMSGERSVYCTTASASISTNSAGSRRLLTSTMEVAGRMEPKTSP